MADALLCVGIDHRYVKACLCDQVAGQWRLVAWLNEQAPAPSTSDLQIDVEPTLVTSRVHWAASTLGRFLDHDLLQALSPASRDRSPAVYAVEQVLLTVSPLPPRRVWVMALTPLWLSVLEDLIQSLEAHLVGVTLCDHRLNALVCSRDLALAAPDLVIVCGGYDISATVRQTLDWAAQVLADSLNESGPVPVIYAGSRQASASFAQILQTQVTGVELTVVDNVVPRPEYIQGDPLHAALHEFCIRTAHSAISDEDVQTWLAPSTGWGSHSMNFIRVLQLWQSCSRPGQRVHGVYHAGGNRLHVLLDDTGAGSIQTAHASGAHQPDAVNQWPAPVIVSGRLGFHITLHADCVYDPRGFMPLLAPMHDLVPEAIEPILDQDLLVPATVV